MKRNEVDKSKLSPMMVQYMDIKDKYEDAIIFFRLGDFYEMFFEDAILASHELELTLTGKNCGLEERVPMCGVPFHSYLPYLEKLVNNGHKVAICEQLTDPKLKGMVERGVIQVVTKGTLMEASSIDEKTNNYVGSIYDYNHCYAISYTDVTTGNFYTELFSYDIDKLINEIIRLDIKELIVNDIIDRKIINTLRENYNILITISNNLLENDTYKYIYEDIKDIRIVNSVKHLLNYLNETKMGNLSHLQKVKVIDKNKYLELDIYSKRNLELVETLRLKERTYSLLWLLDKTKTAMGARLLRNSIEQPLINIDEINTRLDMISEFNDNAISREELREYLGPIYDIERLISKISYKSAIPRDLIAFRQSLSLLPHLKYILSSFSESKLKLYGEELDDLTDIYKLIDESIIEEPPITVREGGIIKDGFNDEFDKLRKAKTEGKQRIADLTEEEKEKTEIKNLKIKYNKVFGYFFEVTNSYKNLVPPEWTVKQTLSNCERYITPRLKELEDTILGAEEKLFTLEYNIFNETLDAIYSEIGRIQQAAKIIAQIDMFASMAVVAEQNNYVRPDMSTDGCIDIKNGRHPVVEKMIKNDMFISNDTFLDNDNHRIAIITGPNMAGKSTYMRQTALIVLMAQIGSYVPAESAKIGIVDRIFTRVGASDDLASGQSTFMVEMTEVSNILRNATKNSLIILDEIGRGTSTFDGLSIAWAVVEYIAIT